MTSEGRQCRGLPVCVSASPLFSISVPSLVCSAVLLNSGGCVVVSPASCCLPRLLHGVPRLWVGSGTSRIVPVSLRCPVLLVSFLSSFLCCGCVVCGVNGGGVLLHCGTVFRLLSVFCFPTLPSLYLLSQHCWFRVVSL